MFEKSLKKIEFGLHANNLLESKNLKSKRKSAKNLTRKSPRKRVKTLKEKATLMKTFKETRLYGVKSKTLKGKIKSRKHSLKRAELKFDFLTPGIKTQICVIM